MPDTLNVKAKTSELMILGCLQTSNQTLTRVGPLCTFPSVRIPARIAKLSSRGEISLRLAVYPGAFFDLFASEIFKGIAALYNTP